MTTKIQELRQPIVTVCGHVDHGKTSLLDKIRGSSIASKEAGGITQKISFTLYPKEAILEKSSEILDKFKIPLEIPGLLFIDTPGHAAFTNLRKRGGSLADIAILVIDINDGLKPQTIEVLQILKANKTPFIVALNKIDNISGWKTSEDLIISLNLERQVQRIKENFEEKFYSIAGALNSHGFDAELFFKISDFTKKIAIVPCSARTGEGISEILAMLVALSQKFLKERIKVKKSGKGVVLEVKKERTMNFLESILYDGSLKEGDEVAIASFDDVIVTKIRGIQEALPLNRGYQSVKKVDAAAGMRLQITGKDIVYSGMPFQVIEKNLAEIKKAFHEEISSGIKTDSNGIIIKAESLGSLEALMFLLKQKQIPVIRAGVGNITKNDIYQANANPEDEKIILGFNVALDEEVETGQVKLLVNDVVYKLIEDLEKWQQDKRKEMERAKLEGLAQIVKVTILPYVFRNLNPAIFGVRVEGGILKQDIELINSDGKKIARVKGIQEEKNSIQEAGKGKEVAISLPGVNFERELEKGESLYSNISEFQFKKFKQNKDVLGKDEVKVLQEIAEIKRKENPVWGV